MKVPELLNEQIRFLKVAPPLPDAITLQFVLVKGNAIGVSHTRVSEAPKGQDAVWSEIILPSSIRKIGSVNSLAQTAVPAVKCGCPAAA
jgi:hypothetical protein